MIYSHEDNHKLVKEIKNKGWDLFEVYGNRVTSQNGIHGGYWLDCSVSFETDQWEDNKVINGLYLGDTMKDAIKHVKSDKFPVKIK